MELNYDDLLHDLTLHGMHAMIELSGKEKSSLQFIMLKQGDPSFTPIVLIHPGNGALFQYQPLLNETNTKGSIFGIRNTTQDPRHDSMTTIEDYASAYHQLLKENINAPVILAGWSFGGTVAYEMSRQHEEMRSTQIIGIVSFDSWANYPSEFNSAQLFQRLVQEWFGDNHPSNGNTVELLKHRMAIILKYTPSKLITTPLKLLKAKEHSLGETSNNHWEKYSNCLSTFIIPGNHNTILNAENIHSTTAMFNKAIKDLLINNKKRTEITS